jgi:hypothetical protein
MTLGSVRQPSEPASRQPGSASGSASWTYGITSNAEIAYPKCATFCNLEASGAQCLRSAVERLGLSARADHCVLRVSRTIADLAGEELIAPMHLADAIQYQTPRARNGERTVRSGSPPERGLAALAGGKDVIVVPAR